MVIFLQMTSSCTIHIINLLHADPVTENSQSFPYEDLVFRILCPDDKVDSVIGVPDGIIELLRADFGVGVRVNEIVPGSHERVIIITSEKDNGESSSASQEQKENSGNEDRRQSRIKRFPAPFVTRSTLEVVIPSYAVRSLLMRSGSKLAQITEMSGAKVSQIEDQPEETEKIVKISGTPEQSERAQSLLQGFILSTQDNISFWAK